MSDEKKVPATLDLDKIRERLLLGTPDRDFVDDHVMPVVEGLVEALKQFAQVAKDLRESHHALMMDSTDPGSDAIGAEYRMGILLDSLALDSPVDWNYISRFSATPNEIHQILADGLYEDVYLAYQRFIGKAVAAEAAEDIRSDRYDTHTAEDAAARIDPVHGGGPYPKRLITPEG